MANALNRLSQHTVEWDHIVRSSIEGQSSLNFTMIADEICRVTTSLAEFNKILPITPSQLKVTQQIIEILERHAKTIPPFRNAGEIKQYCEKIQSCIEIAKSSEDLQGLATRVDALRQEGFHLTAHNKQEIEEMLEAKGSLFELQSALNYCKKVQYYSQNRETLCFRDRLEISNLKKKGEDFSRFDFLVLNRAKKTLDLMMHPPQKAPIEPAVKIEPAPLINRVISWTSHSAKEVLKTLFFALKWVCSPIRAFT